MTQVSDRPAERPRVREQREERELGAGGVVPEALTRLFNQLWADDGEGSGGGASLSGSKLLGGAAMIEALAEQLAPRLLATSQWPLQAVLYLPRLGRINATVRREQNSWSIDLEAQEETTARWLSSVRQQCEDRFALTLEQPVSLFVPNAGCAC